jgi:hypothetical protein
MPTVTVRPGEPDEYTIPFTFGWEQRQIVGRMRRLKIDVDRAEAKAANLNPKTDQIELSGVDTVLLTDVKTGGSTWTLVCYSAEWLANRAGYTPGGDLREGTDQQLINDLISEVDGWTAGTVNSFTGPLSFVFSHAQRHEALRRIEPNVPGEIQFRDFGTVDYIDRLGSDKSASVELSSSAGTIEDSITITERNRELSGTHIRVLGAHEGEAQLYVNLVPADDTDAQNNLENVVTYQTPRWTQEADTDWDRWSNNDITDQATLEEEAANLGAELTDVHVTAETVVPTSVGLEIGDTVQVVKPDADLDRQMRVHKKWRRAGGRNDTDSDAAIVDKVELSTRTTLQTESDADLEELRKFNTGFQGSSVSVQGGGSRQPVDADLNAEIPFFYPELEFENSAEIQFRGLAYRAYSRGAASGGSTTQTSATNAAAEFQNAVSFIYDPGTTEQIGTVFELVPDSPQTFDGALVTLSFFNSSGSSTTFDISLENLTTGDLLFLQSNETVADLEIETFYATPDTSLVSVGDQLEMNVEADTADGVGTVSGRGAPLGYIEMVIVSEGLHGHSVTTQDHTHPVEPGVLEFDRYPANCLIEAGGDRIGQAAHDERFLYSRGVGWEDWSFATFGDGQATAQELDQGYFDATTTTQTGEYAEFVWYHDGFDLAGYDDIQFEDEANTDSAQNTNIWNNIVPSNDGSDAGLAVSVVQDAPVEIGNVDSSRVLLDRSLAPFFGASTNWPFSGYDISGFNSTEQLQIHAYSEAGENIDLARLSRVAVGSDFEATETPTQEVVDIAGELTTGAWNDIEITSEQLGHIQATIALTGYDQIGKR